MRRGDPRWAGPGRAVRRAPAAVGRAAWRWPPDRRLGRGRGLGRLGGRGTQADRRPGPYPDPSGPCPRAVGTFSSSLADLGRKLTDRQKTIVCPTVGVKVIQLD